MTTTLRMPDGVALTAQQERQAWAAVHGGGSGRQLGARSGFRVGTPANILSATSTTWTLGPCAATIDPGASLHQGGYGWSSDANITGSVTAADATYARKDIVYIQVNDSSAGDGSGATSAPVLYLAGTPSASPAAPALPARSFLLGTITVPAAGGGSPTVVRNPAVYVAAGGILPVFSQAEQDALTQFDGLTIRRVDLEGAPLAVSIGGAWNTDTRTRGFVGSTSDTTTSTGLSGVGVTANLVAVTLTAGRRYKATYTSSIRSTEANLGVVGSFRKSATSDTSSAGTVFDFDQIIFTSPRTSTWGSYRFSVDWSQSVTETVNVKLIMARVAGTDAFDISSRKLLVEDIGAA